MNHLSPSDATSSTESLSVSSTSLEEEEFSPKQFLALQVEEFLKESVLQNWPLKSLSPDRVAIFCKIGNSMFSYSPMELSGLTEKEKENRLNNLCAEAIERLKVDLSEIELSKGRIVTVYALFFQHLGPNTAFHAVKGFCSMDNYRVVSSTIAPKLSNSNARAFISTQYTNKMMTRPQSDLMAFFFPVQTLEGNGNKKVKSFELLDVIDI